MTTSIDLNRFAQIKATGHLPSPRGVALAIMRTLDDEKSSIAELARVIKGDPAFVGRLIKAANGALFRQRAIVSVQEALMVLGMPAVRALSLGFSLLSNYRKGVCQGFDYMRFWSSSIIMALTMQRLAARLRAVAADEFFSVGLLARVGELALATVYPVKYGQLLTADKPEKDLLTREQQAFAMTHADLGAALLADWGIPSVFTNAVRYFECPQEAPFAVDGREILVMQCLTIAKYVADICLGKADEQSALIGKAVRLAAHLGCARENFTSDCNEVARQWPGWSRLLQLGDAKSLSFEALSGIEGDALEFRVQSAVSESGDKATFGASGMETTPSVRAVLVTSDAFTRKKMLKALGETDIETSEYPCLNGLMEHILDVQPQMLVLDVEDDVAYIVSLLRVLRASRFGRGMFVLLLLLSADKEYVAATEAGADDFFVKTSGEWVLLARLSMARRIVLLQRELEHEREELRRFAAELAISNRSLQEAALTDALTGLPNRRYALERMQQEWSTSQRSTCSLACMVIDLDNFKQINDIYGHDVGDMALRLVSETLRRVLRSQDVICRTGGDEFLVICPETSKNEAIICGERLRKKIENLAIPNEDKVLRLSISIGVAVRDGYLSNVGDLIKKADRAALMAKRQGRNRVVSEFDVEK